MIKSSTQFYQKVRKIWSSRSDENISKIFEELLAQDLGA